MLFVGMWPNKAVRLERLERGESIEQTNKPIFIVLKVGKPNPFREELEGKVERKANKDPTPFAFMLNSEQILVSASGAELELIRTHMTNVPWCIKSSTNKVIWMGDHAKFIALNFDF